SGSFSADSEQEKEEWVEAMRQSIAEALSNSEVAERIWAVESNRFCADCGSPKPDWASINLCVVICKRCAGEHRGLGPGITKVRSLKMDRKVWTEELIEVLPQTDPENLFGVPSPWWPHPSAPQPVGVHSPLFSRSIESTFELYTESERLYLFGLESPDSAREWVKCIAKSFIHPGAEELLALDFERIGRLHYKGGLNLERAKEGWFALAGSALHVSCRDGEQQDPLQLRKLQELSIQGDNEVLVLVERRRTLYIQGERKLDFLGWVHAIQKAAGSGGDTLSEQQLTESDVPLLVDRCIDYITQCGLTSEGIYRKSGQNSKTTNLLEMLRRDARSVRLKEGEHQVDDVANTLKRFFRDLGDGLFTARWGPDWLRATALEDEEAKIDEYRRLLSTLPTVNRATLKALINHLFRVQRFSGENQMNTHNLAIVFGPKLFQTDGKDYKAGRVVEDLISHYVKIFNVNEQEMKKQQDEIMAIMKMREAASSGKQQAGDFICTVYLEEKKTEAEQHVKIPATMTAEELTFEILDRRKIVMKEKDYWSCFEVNEREEAERPLHYSEKVLPILHGLGTESYLVVKKQMSMENMLIYL
ncbi:PREDICTED: LOW QUALITY PROTEIN: arf-GAP with Rho-GAP domain, ANK repeat and PH domain-containing protein 1, partial [Charadrius vociferus]|uniref:LOW QUALITY PROTEIN: arf-GAP with Rho-GAP domain, ANK repeat and PH domain-containing protein 1 n=1 Tax=Charadrius vociferus TaxID=50402 RepID=UPI0005219E4C